MTLSLVISVVRLDKGNFAGAKLPRYEALRGERPPDLETTVILPDSVFRGQWGATGWVRGPAGASLCRALLSGHCPDPRDAHRGPARGPWRGPGA